MKNLYLLDNNFIIDVITERKERKEIYLTILQFILKNESGYISSSSIHNIHYIVNKFYPEEKAMLKEVLKKLKIAKTPSYIDYENPLAQLDIEDYLIELSAKTVGATIITSDRLFLKSSDIAISPVEFFGKVEQEEKKHKVPFLDLKRSNYEKYPELEKAYDDTIRSGWFILGKQVEAFEREFLDYCGVKYCIGVGNGLDALVLILEGYKEL